MSVAAWFAAQLRLPSGRAGRVMGHLLNRASRRIGAEAVSRLQVGSTDDVLEVGFGGGAALAAILERTQGLVAGIEPSDAMLAQARRRFQQAIPGGRVELSKGIVSALPYEDERFDRVLTINTIYFWPDHDAGLREIARVLKPGGRLQIATVAKETMDKAPWTRHGFRKFTDDELAQLLHTAGFAEVSVERHGSGVFSSGTNPAA